MHSSSNLPRALVESAWQAERLGSYSLRQKSFTEIHSWSLVFSLTHTLIFHSRISLVYGSTCSLLVLSYYKCLLRLNSDIAKAFHQCSNSPRTSLSKTMGLKFSKNVAILTFRIASGTTLSLRIKAKLLSYTGIYNGLGSRSGCCFRILHYSWDG